MPIRPEPRLLWCLPSDDKPRAKPRPERPTQWPSTAATEAQTERIAEDVWEDAILAWLPCRAEVRTADVLSSCLNIPKERQGKREQMRVAAILTGIGWTRWQYRPSGKGKLVRAWFAPDRLPKTGPPSGGQQEMGL